MKSIRKIIGVAVMGAALMTVTACGAEDTTPEQSPAGQGGKAAPSPSASPPGTLPNGEVSMAEAAKAALVAVPGSHLLSIDLEGKPAERRWDVMVSDAKGVEYEVDVKDGKVLKEPEAAPGGEAERTRIMSLIAGDKIGYAKAAKAALTRVPEGQIEELELDTYKKAVVWDVDVLTTVDGTQDGGNGAEANMERGRTHLRINAADGAILN